MDNIEEIKIGNLYKIRNINLGFSTINCLSTPKYDSNRINIINNSIVMFLYRVKEQKTAYDICVLYNNIICYTHIASLVDI